jgi:hypothetical protein
MVASPHEDPFHLFKVVKDVLPDEDSILLPGYTTFIVIFGDWTLPLSFVAVMLNT